MGGKGQKRREKNYLKSHGGDKRLPPPPNSSSYVDVIPSKLRKLMSFSTSLGNVVNSESENQFKDKKGDGSQKNPKSVVPEKPKSTSISTEIDKLTEMIENEEKMSTGVDEDKNSKKKKRKRKEVNDLRFAAEMEKLGVTSKRKQRKKEFLKNKKKKQKKGAPEQTLDLPKRDDVKFGDVVQAPPKLNVVPKASKKPMTASNERLRLQAIEAYRSRRGTNRLGIQLPSLDASSEQE